MKKIKLFAISVLAALGLNACTEDFITVSPASEILKDNYFTQDSRVFTSVVAAYDPLQWFDYFYQYNPLNMVSDIMADDIYCGGASETDQAVLVKAHFYQATALDCCNQIWTIAYSGINRSNIAIEEAEKMTDLPDAIRNRYIAEGLVLKAYYYNILWKFWGNIPFYDNNLTAPYYTDQIKADEVYAEVIKMIEDALKLNGLPFQAEAGEEGRVTTPMAYMLYAEMVMYQRDNSRYATALGYMNEIINSGKYGLLDDFASIWEESGEWSKESIWEINYISEGAVRSWGSPIATGGTVYPMLIGVPGADPTGIYQPGWGFGPVAKHAYDMYEDNDQRKDGGILYYQKYMDETGAAPQGEERWQHTGYFLKKYIARVGGNHGQKADGDMNYGTNMRVYRYAEVLLNAAELELALNQGDKGKAKLNQVQQRAGVTPTESTLENIITERRKEFLGEGKRYWDLVRTDMAAEVLKASNHEYRSVDWTINKKYWPIPQSEMDKVDEAHKMTQNPY